MKHKGFSLIELLVVIAIIASIVALAIPNYLSARQRAQDIKIKTEMSELKKALRLYYNDNNKYPANSSSPTAGYGRIMGCGVAGLTACPCTSGGINFATGAACDNIYMKQLPSAMGTNSMLYFQKASGEDFCLTAALNNLSDPDIVASETRCSSACGGSCPSPKYCVCAD